MFLFLQKHTLNANNVVVFTYFNPESHLLLIETNIKIGTNRILIKKKASNIIFRL